jgi:hypothetical protein
VWGRGQLLCSLTSSTPAGCSDGSCHISHVGLVSISTCRSLLTTCLCLPHACACSSRRFQASAAVDLATSQRQHMWLLAQQQALLAQQQRAQQHAVVPTTTPERSGAPYQPATFKQAFARRNAAPMLRSEFYSLGAAANAAVLARLCSHLLDTSQIRAEVDRREANGLFHAGEAEACGGLAEM